MEILLCRSETFILARVEHVQMLATMTIYVRHLIRHGNKKYWRKFNMDETVILFS